VAEAERDEAPLVGNMTVAAYHRLAVPVTHGGARRPSVVFRFYPAIASRTTRPRRTFSRMASAVAVHTKGLGFSLFAFR
jgi:hypothetical protein